MTLAHEPLEECDGTKCGPLCPYVCIRQAVDPNEVLDKMKSLVGDYRRQYKPRVSKGCKECNTPPPPRQIVDLGNDRQTFVDSVPFSERRYIAHGEGQAGLGDALLGLCSVRGYAAEHPNEGVTYGAAYHTVSFTRLFDNPDSFDYGWGRRMDPFTGDLGIGLNFDHTCREPYWTRLRAYGATIGDPIPILPKLLERDRVKDLCKDYGGSIILCPCVAKSNYRNREYPRHSWLSLANRLRDLGHQVLIADNVHQRLELFHSHELIMGPAEGWPPERFTSLMLNAACVVGNDSGLAHLAGIVGAPTLTLNGVTEGDKIFDFYSRVTNLQGKLGCDGCWWGGAYRPDLCDTGCASLAGISTDQIIEAIGYTSKRATAKIRIVSQCSQEYRDLDDLTWPSKQAYAIRHGLDWHRGLQKHDLTWRVWLDQLEQVPEGNWIWVLDSDAKITGDQDVRQFLGGDIIVASDWNGINCGSMLLRNCQGVRSLIRQAIAERYKSRWQEQGLVLALAPLHRVDVRQVPLRSINSYGIDGGEEHRWQSGDLVCHLPGRSMAERLTFFKEH